jgi:hypothetical protein
MHGFTNKVRGLFFLILAAGFAAAFTRPASATPLDEGIYRQTIPAMGLVISPGMSPATPCGPEGR